MNPLQIILRLVAFGITLLLVVLAIFTTFSFLTVGLAVAAVVLLVAKIGMPGRFSRFRRFRETQVDENGRTTTIEGEYRVITREIGKEPQD